ncbi:MAG: hypothetical protein HDT18_00040 [Oscillibacter sp.]|nr:hypothetical protein [Oscillibacter sp.]
MKDSEYSRACDEYRENGRAPDDSDGDGDIGRAEHESAIVVPEEARSMIPGTGDMGLSSNTWDI